MDELIRQLYLRQTRRSFLGAAARGIGSVALASLIDPSLVLGAPATTSATTQHSALDIQHSPNHWNGGFYYRGRWGS